MAIIDKNIQVLMLKGEKGDTGDAGDYSTLANKPTINNTELVGNKSASDLGLATASDLSGMGSTVNTNTSNITTLTANIGNLIDLGTTDKTNIVNAINEVNNKTFHNFEFAGDWTPYLSTDGDVQPMFELGFCFGHYYRIGRLVYITSRIQFNIAYEGEGYATIEGLPFTASQGIGYYALSKIESLNATEQDSNDPTLFVVEGTRMIRVQTQSGVAGNKWANGSGTNSQYIGFSGVYLAD